MKHIDIARHLIEQDFAYRTCLSRGVINYTALAKKIKPVLERTTGYPVATNTIVKMLTRIKTQELKAVDPYGALSRITISVDYGYERKELRSFKYEGNEIMMVNLGDKYEVLYKNKKGTGQALLKIKLNRDMEETPGITVLLLYLLAGKNVEVSSIYRFGDEVWFLLPAGDAPKSIEALSHFTVGLKVKVEASGL